MKSLFGNTVSESIQFDEVAGATSRPFIKTQYFDDSSEVWKDFEDVQSREITLSNENKRYMNFSFVPPSKELNLTLNNANQAYSIGSGDPKSAILKKNLLIKCFSGYELSATGSYATVDNFNGKKYHTFLSGGSLYASMGSWTGTVSKFAMFNTYDKFNLSTREYSPSGYYHNRFEFASTAYDSFKDMIVTTNTDKISARYKVGFEGWSPWKSLVTGVNTIKIDSSADSKSLDYIFRWDVPVWGGNEAISNITINAQRKGYLFERGTFLADDPSYGEQVTIPGRDYLKKGLETEITIPTWTNRTIHGALTDIFDRCSIPYATANWDATSGVISVNASIAEDVGAISGWKAIDYLMDVANGCTDNWLLKWEGDGSMSLKKVVTDVEADYVVDYRYNIESIQKNFNADKQLQRITVLNKEISVNSERLLGNITGTASGASWASGALYVRYVDNVGNVASETSRTVTSLGLSFSGTASRDVDIYGAPYRSLKSWNVLSENGNAMNLLNSDGVTYKLINPFISQVQAVALATKLLTTWQEPQKKIQLTMSSNPYLEMNDNCMIFDLFTYTADIYQIREIKESFNDPSLKDSMTFLSRGFTLPSLIYDANGVDEGINDIKYDKGFTYDQELGIGIEDDRTYLKPTRRA